MPRFPLIVNNAEVRSEMQWRDIIKVSNGILVEQGCIVIIASTARNKIVLISRPTDAGLLLEGLAFGADIPIFEG